VNEAAKACAAKTCAAKTCAAKTCAAKTCKTCALEDGLCANSAARLA
jgi:hypothetical protein